jgi:hypothetical protein
MAAPSGGTGSYHVLVPQGLVFLYHIDQTDAVAFTFIFHGWQTITLIVRWSFSLLITSIYREKKSQAVKPSPSIYLIDVFQELRNHSDEIIRGILLNSTWPSL